MGVGHERTDDAVPGHRGIRAAHGLRRRDITVLVGGEQTDGTYTLWRAIIEEGHGPPRHVHHAEDELFYLLSGQLLAECAGKQVTVDAGGCLLLPRNLPHAFVVTNGPADIIHVANPSGFEKFMAEVGPMPESGELDMDHLLAVCSRYHIDILGPPMQAPSA
jgi:mannose-6-phosphate isomerase-like protein (cupin superfamily)